MYFRRIAVIYKWGEVRGRARSFDIPIERARGTGESQEVYLRAPARTCQNGRSVVTGRNSFTYGGIYDTRDDNMAGGQRGEESAAKEGIIPIPFLIQRLRGAAGGEKPRVRGAAARSPAPPSRSSMFDPYREILSMTGPVI